METCTYIKYRLGPLNGPNQTKIKKKHMPILPNFTVIFELYLWTDGRTIRK